MEYLVRKIEEIIKKGLNGIRLVALSAIGVTYLGYQKIKTDKKKYVPIWQFNAWKRTIH